MFRFFLIQDAHSHNDFLQDECCDFPGSRPKTDKSINRNFVSIAWDFLVYGRVSWAGHLWLIAIELYLCNYKLFPFSVKAEDDWSLTCLPPEFHLASRMLQSFCSVLSHQINTWLDDNLTEYIAQLFIVEVVLQLLLFDTCEKLNFRMGFFSSV